MGWTRAARQEENRRWLEERQKAEDRRRREEALVGDLTKRLELWLAAAATANSPKPWKPWR